MAVHTVVAILIAVGEVSSPTQATTDAMTGAVAEALGPDVSLVLRTTPLASDEVALAIERELGAAAVARVVWDGPDQTVGMLRAHLRSSDRWFERRVSFSPADSRAERGRTLGFAFASLLLTDGEQAQPPPAGRSAASPTVSVERPSPATGAPATVVVAAPPAASPRERAVAIDLAALATTGVGGPAQSLGATLHAEWTVRGSLSARAGALVSAGPVPGLDGQDTLVGLGAGVAFRPRVPEPGRHALGLGLTLEALGLYQDLSHRSGGGSALHEGRVQGAVMAGGEASWAVSRALDLFAGLGAAVAFGTTDVTVAGRPVATIPLFRPTAQAGIRWHD